MPMYATPILIRHDFLSTPRRRRRFASMIAAASRLWRRLELPLTPIFRCRRASHFAAR